MKRAQQVKDVTGEIYALQSKRRDRIDDFRRIVREEFARGRSTYIVSPTIKHAEYLAETLGKGIEQYVYAFHSNLSKKETLKRTEDALSETHPVLIVGTGGFLAIPRTDIGTIIVENESSKAFKMQSRPYLDYRIFARLLAHELSARLIFADMPLSIETMFRLKQRDYEELGSTRARMAANADQDIIDMKPEKGSGDFFVLSSELIHKLEEVVSGGKHAFVFNVRKGIAPTTVCEECGSVVTCTLCGASVVLHSSEPHNVFICHGCGHSRSAKERCTNCESWKLKALGIGTERVKRELISLFGNKKVFTIDKDSAKTYKQAHKVAEQFYKTKGAILVGTEMSLSFLEQPISLGAIASIDSLLSLPDPKMYENIFSLILRVRATASDTFIVQTRQPDLALIKEAVVGNVTQFYEGEILNRRRFEYPPFTQLIKITSTGTVSHISKEMEDLESVLKGYPFHIYPAFSRTSKKSFALSGLLKIPYEQWPDAKLIGILKSLPPNIMVNVNPESTL
jgi:primosomal protein N' (replication factor Y)